MFHIYGGPEGQSSGSSLNRSLSPQGQVSIEVLSPQGQVSIDVLSPQGQVSIEVSGGSRI